MDEVQKKKVDVKSSNNYQTLKKEFEKSLNKINPLLQQIEETNAEIDKIVYELYHYRMRRLRLLKEV